MMTSRWRWLLSQLTRRLWFRASLYSLLAVATAGAATVLDPFIPSDLPGKIGADAVDNILGIMASSMLAVTTFSLSTMVQAYSAATNNVTPRATRLLMEDPTTQNALAAFIGSFLFSLVGIVLLSTEAYGERGRVILFGATIVVIALVVLTLLRWIDHLSRLGRVIETTGRVEQAARQALQARRQAPGLGGRPMEDPAAEVPRDASPIHSEAIGYVQHIDVRALSRAAKDASVEIYVEAPPGTYVDPTRWLARVSGIVRDELPDSVRAAFSVGSERSFDQDPRFGLVVLSEIASRALSPAMNDPGTAIDVIGRAVRLLAIPVQPQPDDVDRGDSCANVHVPVVAVADLFDDIFTPIARDGASMIEVGIRLQKALRSLSGLGGEAYRQSAARHSTIALRRAEANLAIEDDRSRLRDLAAEVG